MAQTVGLTVVSWDELDQLPVGSVAVSPVAYYMRVPTGVVSHFTGESRAVNYYVAGENKGKYLMWAATITHVG